MALFVASRAGARALWAPSRVGVRMASTAADRAEAAARKEADAAIEKGLNLDDFKWRPVREVLQKPNLLDMDVDAYLKDGQPVNIDLEAARYDTEGELSASVARVKQLLTQLQEQDAVHDVLKSIGLSAVGYRKGDVKPINWEYFKKNIHPPAFVDTLKKQFEEDTAKIAEQTSEKNERYQEGLTLLNSSRDGFNKAVAELRELATRQIKGLEKVETVKDKVLDLYSRVETMTVTDLIEENPDAAAIVEQQMLEGRWGVDDTEVKEVATGNPEAYPGNRTNPQPDDLPARFNGRI